MCTTVVVLAIIGGVRLVVITEEGIVRIMIFIIMLLFFRPFYNFFFFLLLRFHTFTLTLFLRFVVNFLCFWLRYNHIRHVHRRRIVLFQLTPVITLLSSSMLVFLSRKQFFPLPYPSTPLVHDRVEIVFDVLGSTWVEPKLEG